MNKHAKYFGDWTDEKGLNNFVDYEESDHFNGFDNETKSSIEKRFKDCDIIVAAYERGDYQGCAFILYKKDGKLYEINDSHCSCNGLTNLEAEETFKEALLKRTVYVYDDSLDKQIRNIIEGL